MTRLRPRLALLAATAAIGGCGGDDDPSEAANFAQALAAQRASTYTLYWVGRSIAGLALSDVLRARERTSFIYGTCDPGGSDTGCAPPLEIQVSSICDDNALALDIRPDAQRTARGTLVLDYGEAGRLALDAGTSHVTVSAEPALSRRVVAALRPVTGSQRVAAALPAPRYPRSYVEELRGVRDAYVRLGDVRAVRTERRISKSAVRFELGLARELGAQRLRRRAGWSPGPGCSTEPA